MTLAVEEVATLCALSPDGQKLCPAIVVRVIVLKGQQVASSLLSACRRRNSCCWRHSCQSWCSSFLVLKFSELTAPAYTCQKEPDPVAAGRLRGSSGASARHRGSGEKCSGSTRRVSHETTRLSHPSRRGCRMAPPCHRPEPVEGLSRRLAQRRSTHC